MDSIFLSRKFFKIVFKDTFLNEIISEVGAEISFGNILLFFKDNLFTAEKSNEFIKKQKINDYSEKGGQSHLNLFYL